MDSAWLSQVVPEQAANDRVFNDTPSTQTHILGLWTPPRQNDILSPFEIPSSLVMVPVAPDTVDKSPREHKGKNDEVESQYPNAIEQPKDIETRMMASLPIKQVIASSGRPGSLLSAPFPMPKVKRPCIDATSHTSGESAPVKIMKRYRHQIDRPILPRRKAVPRPPSPVTPILEVLKGPEYDAFISHTTLQEPYSDRIFQTRNIPGLPTNAPVEESTLFDRYSKDNNGHTALKRVSNVLESSAGHVSSIPEAHGVQILETLETGPNPPISPVQTDALTLNELGLRLEALTLSQSHKGSIAQINILENIPISLTTAPSEEPLSSLCGSSSCSVTRIPSIPDIHQVFQRDREAITLAISPSTSPLLLFPQVLAPVKVTTPLEHGYTDLSLSNPAVAPVPVRTPERHTRFIRSVILSITPSHVKSRCVDTRSAREPYFNKHSFTVSQPEQ
ncbi:hypothetical protein K439DRAFT_945389 [Ramaria rubella]|nr:hypothetical protein K439DRAFT_945389 [Ramaria rubella]